ncbi:MAG: hypothetical protein NWE75_04325, partial [Candidatus Bathyarchaeota archaeon]|nr:hypothetical protein [Candidatus Bathyarchaeota archaeon]
TFYPREGPLQWLGPIEDYVLSDLAAWLKHPERGLRFVDTQLQAAEETIHDLQIQLGELRSELDMQGSYLESREEEWQSEHSSLRDAIAELEGLNAELRSTLDSSRFMTYVALGIAVIAVLVVAVMAYKRLSS